MPSNAQIDGLGDRLRKGISFTDDDLTQLDEYRVSFRDAYDAVMRVCQSLGFEPTGRFGKSTRSVIAKLKREHVRLAQIQDIVGCRIVLSVTGADAITKQDEAVKVILEAFQRSGIATKVYDRRSAPSHGYRAVHIVALPDGKPVDSDKDGSATLVCGGSRTRSRCDWQRREVWKREPICARFGQSFKSICD